MYKHKFNNNNDSKECDLCYRKIDYYIDYFKLDLCLPKKNVILQSDLFTQVICLKCLNTEIKKLFIEDLKVKTEGA